MIETHDIFVSSLRWATGLSLGICLGLILGLILSSKHLAGKSVGFLSDFFRAVPILGLVPIIQFYIGVDEIGKIGLIAWATLFPIAYSVKSSVRDISADTQVNLKHHTRGTLKKVYLVTVLGAREGVTRSVNIAIGIAWLVVVAAELIGTYTQGFWRGGLGYKLFLAYEHNDPATMFLILFIFGFLGILSSLAWNKISKVIIR